MNEQNQIKNETKKGFRKGFLFGLAAALLLTAITGCSYHLLSGGSSSASSSGSGAGSHSGSDSFFSDFTGSTDLVDEETLSKIGHLEELVEENFLFDYTKEEMREGLYEGMINRLGDEYSVYYTPEESKQFYETVSGNFSGVGILLRQDPDTGFVSAQLVFAESPAEKAGFLAGDIIRAVDGEDVTGYDVSEVANLVRGEIGTDVTVTIDRDGEEMDLTATRDMIETPTVFAHTIEGHIGYLCVIEFDDVTLGQFEENLTELVNSGIDSLIIDLRGNPGGNVDTCTDMLDLLLPDGLLVYMEDKFGARDEYYAKDGDIEPDIPMVILVDEGSASASEIFTGAMQDYGKATVIGTQSFGKGIVQAIIPVGDGSTLKLTYAEYFTPKGQKIHGIGVTPDVIAEPSDPDYIFDPYSLDLENDDVLHQAVEFIKGEL